MTGRGAFRRARQVILLGLFAASAIIFTGCEVPVIERPECTAARNAIREFYSFHFGNDMTPSGENLKSRERFLTPKLFGSLSGSGESNSDYFTSTKNDYPKAFRVGACVESTATKADVEVLIFWRDDVRQEQRTIRVQAVKSGDEWLVDKVSGN